jgi:hypothetical protein
MTTPLTTLTKHIFKGKSTIYNFKTFQLSGLLFKFILHQWRLVGFIVEEANLNKHSNNKYTIIIYFLNILYRVPQNSRNSLPVRCYVKISGKNVQSSFL